MNLKVLNDHQFCLLFLLDFLTPYFELEFFVEIENFTPLSIFGDMTAGAWLSESIVRARKVIGA